MHSLEKIRDLLMDELDKCAEKDSISNNSLYTIDKLTHAIKSIDTIMAMEEAGYSNDYSGRSNARGGSYARRDSRGRYSRNSYDDMAYGRGGGSGRSYRSGRGYSRDEAKDDLVEQLREISNSTDGENRQMIENWIRQVEQG